MMVLSHRQTCLFSFTRWVTDTNLTTHHPSFSVRSLSVCNFQSEREGMCCGKSRKVTLKPVFSTCTVGLK